MRKASLAAVTLFACGFAVAQTGPAAAAASHDGAWTVLIVTQEGPCEGPYRYNVRVSDGRITYEGSTSAVVNGTVSTAGAVKVSISLGGNSANGTGRLRGSAGAGSWRGAGANAACAGRWEAERR